MKASTARKTSIQCNSSDEKKLDMVEIRRQFTKNKLSGESAARALYEFVQSHCEFHFLYNSIQDGWSFGFAYTVNVQYICGDHTFPAKELKVFAGSVFNTILRARLRDVSSIREIFNRFCLEYPELKKAYTLIGDKLVRCEKEIVCPQCKTVHNKHLKYAK